MVEPIVTANNHQHFVCTHTVTKKDVHDKPTGVYKETIVFTGPDAETVKKHLVKSGLNVTHVELFKPNEANPNPVVKAPDGIFHLNQEDRSLGKQKGTLRESTIKTVMSILHEQYNKPLNENVLHPHKDEYGRSVTIKSPHKATGPETWHDPDAVAVFTPGSPVPDHMKSSGMEYSKSTVVEPKYHAQPGFKTSAGVVMHEPDGRVWLTSPTNQFGGYNYTFPKGTHENTEPSLQHTARKEAYEETGMVSDLKSHLGDYSRTTSKTRYYVGNRVAGSPADMGWESQAMTLVPPHKLHDYVHSDTDHKIVDDYLAHIKKKS